MTSASTKKPALTRTRPGRRDSERTVTEAAARLMSETAHDLRSPLTTIRESVRLLHDGELGQLTSDQKSYAAAALDQCDCMDQMIGEMVQLERLRTGTPRVHRAWVSVSNIRGAVDETLRPWALPRNIDVMWDGADDPNLRVYGDASMLRRLIVNLVANAIRVTPEGGCVLIRLERVSGGDSIRWSVVDQGSGISQQDMQQIARRQVSLGGGEGLGLSICRQLAALHFSSLQLRSRLGSGTVASFETAAAGPRSVAESWSRWRVEQSRSTPEPEFEGTTRATERRMRLDPPSISVELSHEASTPRCTDQLASGIVTVGATVSREAADRFDNLMQSQLRMFDLVYRVDTRSWVWVLDTDLAHVRDRIESIFDAAAREISGLRMSWSDPQMIPVDARKTMTRLGDLMVRRALAASTPDHVVDKNEVRLGTAPIAQSDVASARLDAELRRFNDQLCRQSKRLRQQARTLRPKNQ